MPKNDREDKPIVFDSYDMSPVWLGTGASKRPAWFYFTENELSPGAIRVTSSAISTPFLEFLTDSAIISEVFFGDDGLFDGVHAAH